MPATEPTRIPDLRGTPLGRSGTQAQATAVILRRVLPSAQAGQPDAAFQSSI